ncbi:hypothetical protein RMATCC62417_01753 [Rhizopus microsporus]|nr:hypothetical protein RMATCC62417_01753 [Rhizopus microsporus]
MFPSLQAALPSIERLNKKRIEQPLPKKELVLVNQRNHIRTTSAPSILPSYGQKLSLNVLLDAIDLDQEMRQFFRNEVMKSKNRTQLGMFKPMPMLRRRSRSAPSALPSYHYQRAFNAKWIMNDKRVVTTASEAQKVAELIVKQHFETVKKNNNNNSV